jgi:hypothetical protein
LESHLAVIHLGFELLGLLDLPGCLREVLLDNIVPVVSDSKHAALRADVPEIGAVEVLADLGDGLEVDITVSCDRFSVNFDDLQSGGLVG